MNIYDTFNDEMLDLLNLVVADRIRWIRKQKNLPPTATVEQSDMFTAEIILEARNLNDYSDRKFYTINGPEFSEKEVAKMKTLLEEKYSDIIAVVKAYIFSSDESTYNRDLTEIYKDGAVKLGLL